MVSKKDVELAALVPERTKKITDIRLVLAKETQEEEDRRQVWSRQYYARQAEIKAAEAELLKAAEAQDRIMQQVPRELRLAVIQAGTGVRAQAEPVVQARSRLMDREAVYKARLDASRKPGGDALTKDQAERFGVEIRDLRKAYDEELQLEKDLKAALVKAQKAVDDEVARLKKLAK